MILASFKLFTMPPLTDEVADDRGHVIRELDFARTSAERLVRIWCVFARRVAFCSARNCKARFSRVSRKCLEPISKSPEEDNEASELYEAEEVPGVVFPTDEDAALPLNPSKEELHEPASHIAAQPSPILRGRLASVAAMRRDHLDAVLAQLLIEWIAIVGAIANQILRLGLDHVEVKA